MAATMPGTVPVGGLAGAPDVATIGRLGTLVGLLRADAAGGAGVGGRGVIGYDRGDATRTFGGPVYLTQSPAAAYAAIGTGSGIYQPTPSAQDVWSNDPALNSFRRATYARMIAGA